MAMRQLALPGKVVKKSNALARARWVAESVWEPRLVALVASKIHKDDENFQKYSIHISEIIRDDGGKSYKEIESIIDKIMGRIITIRTENGWKKYTVFSSCSFTHSNGIIEIEFHPDLKPHFLQLKERFIQYNLMEYLLLPSIYSQKMFEFLKSWSDKPETIISISDLHEMLNVPDSLKKDFRNLRIRVLEKAYKDISKHTNLEYKWESIKKGRAVVAIRFLFPKKGINHNSKRPVNTFTAANECHSKLGNNCGRYNKESEICRQCKILYSPPEIKRKDTDDHFAPAIRPRTRRR